MAQVFECGHDDCRKIRCICLTSDQFGQPTKTSYTTQSGTDARENDQNTVASAVCKAGVMERLNVYQLLADRPRCHRPNAFAHTKQRYHHASVDVIARLSDRVGTSCPIGREPATCQTPEDDKHIEHCLRGGQAPAERKVQVSTVSWKLHGLVVWLQNPWCPQCP